LKEQVQTWLVRDLIEIQVRNAAGDDLFRSDHLAEQFWPQTLSFAKVESRPTILERTEPGSNSAGKIIKFRGAGGIAQNVVEGDLIPSFQKSNGNLAGEAVVFLLLDVHPPRPDSLQVAPLSQVQQALV
jgi:hypothetical protein